MERQQREEGSHRRPLVRPKDRRAFEERIRGGGAPTPPPSQSVPQDTAQDRSLSAPVKHQEDPEPGVPGVRKRHMVSRKAGIGLAALLVLMIGCTALYIMKRSSGVLPASITKSSSVPIYYPSRLPDGYRLVRNTPRISNGVIFFTISDGSKRQFAFSEQPAPLNPPDFDAIQKSYSSLKKMSVAGGQGVAGTYHGAPTAIILTNTTLINVSGTSDSPADVLLKLVNALQSLPS